MKIRSIGMPSDYNDSCKLQLQAMSHRINKMHFDPQLISHMRLKQNNEVESILRGYKYLQKFVDSSGQSLLHVASKLGNAEITRYLIECGCKVDAQDKLGITPLMLAVTDAKDDLTVEVLLAANANIHLVDNVSKSSAFRKVIKMSLTWLEHLSAGWFQKTNYYRIIKMFFSKVEQEFAVDRELLAENLREAHCPLALVMFMGNTFVTEYLLDVGFFRDELIRNWSTLHIAVLLGDVDNIRVLLNNGADVNDLDNQRQTPLFLYDKSVESPRQLEILELLMRHGASLTTPRFDGVTPMEYFFSCGTKNTLMALVKTDCRELEKSTPKGRTPLHFLVQNKNKGVHKVMELLLKRTNIEVDARDVKGKTALVDAVNAGFIDKIKFLTNFGAKVNLIDIFDKTDLFDDLTGPDWYTAKNARVVDVLVRRGNYRIDCKSNPEDIFSVHKGETFVLAKLLLKHLVLDEASGGHVNESVFMKIESKKELHKYYELCKLQMQGTKTTIIYGTVTLYKLLSESEEKVTLYARNQDFVDNFEEFMKDKSGKTFYYYDFLRKRVDGAIKTAELRGKASRVICGMSKLYPDPNHDVFYKISKFLSAQDLNNLLKV